MFTPACGYAKKFEFGSHKAPLWPGGNNHRGARKRGAGEDCRNPVVEQQGRTLATARPRLAAIAAAHPLGEHLDPTSDPLVKATLKRLAKEHGKPCRQAKGLTSEGLATVKATEAEATTPALVDLALLQVMWDGLLRRSEASALRWDHVELHEDGSGRIHLAKSKTDQSAEGAVRYLY